MGSSRTEGVRETHAIEIDGVRRDLPLFHVAPDVRIAVFNMLGDTEIIMVAATALARRLEDVDADVLVTAETKSVPLVFQLASLTGLPWVVLRKAYKPYMGDALSAETLSITTGAPQTLYLDEANRALVRGRRVVLADDVVSTGSTLEAMRLLMRRADAGIAAEAAVFTEGDHAREETIIALGHLPIFEGR
ncbi:MAG: adenine phosphoribosyltransferase [Actinobacteria bacterium]|nr:adenine phosphoribosyltransferase [Actinomycetota bacterium]